MMNGQQDLLRRMYGRILAPTMVVVEFQRLALEDVRFQGLAYPDFIEKAAPERLLPSLVASSRFHRSARILRAVFRVQRKTVPSAPLRSHELHETHPTSTVATGDHSPKGSSSQKHSRYSRYSGWPGTSSGRSSRNTAPEKMP